jgi:hypothetical protein
MLDVHPPHASTHTWRDFLLHIATIVVGLLIAISLEQTVEYLHHRHQVEATREALRVEVDKTRTDIDDCVVAIRRGHAALDNNLTVLLYLKQHPGTPPSKLPGILTWHSATDELSTSAWTTASQSTVLTLFPDHEVASYNNFYRHIALVNQASEAYWITMNDARLYAFHDPDPTHMSPAELDETIARTKSAIESLYIFASAIATLNRQFPDFARGFPSAEGNQIAHTADIESNPDLAVPRSQTIQRLDAAGKARDFFPQAAPPTK